MISLKKKLEKHETGELFELINSRRSSALSKTTQNSFLLEVEHNSDIDDSIRSEINKRFNRSIVNATYKFPRIAHSPFPSITNQSKNSPKSFVPKKAPRKFLKSIRLVSHTPKPSINQSINFSKRLKSKNPEEVQRLISITPTPMSFTLKSKKPYDFPKLKTPKLRSPYMIPQSKH